MKKSFTLFILSLLAALNIRAAEVYTHFDPETGVLTYYYGYMAAHSGYNKELYDPTSTEKRFVGYSENIRKVVIDESMKDALLTSTVGMFWGGTSKPEMYNMHKGLSGIISRIVLCLVNRPRIFPGH